MGLTGLSRDALHVYAGMLVFLLAAVILRRSLRSPVPWLATVAVACGMEVVDAIAAPCRSVTSGYAAARMT